VIASDVKGSRANLSGADKGIESRANGLPSVRTSARSTVGQLARAQKFRFLTMLATWALIFAAFVYEPGWIRDSLQFITHSIESLADQVPEPWERAAGDNVTRVVLIPVQAAHQNGMMPPAVTE
jgi:hypothetical protein